MSYPQIMPHARRVLTIISAWHRNITRGLPVNAKAIPRSDGILDTVATRYQHKIAFRYNELEWVAQALNAYDSSNRQARIFTERLERHRELEQQGKISTSVPFEQPYDFTQKELEFVAVLIAKILSGKPPESREQKEAKKEEIEGNW